MPWHAVPRHRTLCHSMVDAARSTGPSASLDYGWTWLCIFSDPTWIRTLAEFWRFLFKVPPQLDFSILLGLSLGPGILTRTPCKIGPLARPHPEQILGTNLESFTKTEATLRKQTIDIEHERHQDTHERRLGAKRGSKVPKRGQTS